MLLAGCGWFKSGESATQAGATTTRERLAERQRLQRTCASTATFDRLKVVVFDKAAQIRGARSDVLDSLAAVSLVRMESPVVKGRDDALNVTVCAGRFVLELPEGAARAFGGERRLKADVEYSAQQAVDNSGIVYQIQGAEPIAYRLSAVGMGQQANRPSSPSVIPEVLPRPLPPVPAVDREVEQRPSRPPVSTTTPPAPVARPPVVRELPRPPRDIVASRPPREASEPPRQAAAVPRVARSRPSFNCARATLRVEQAVCSSDRLAAADRAMSSTYLRAVAQADPETRNRLSASRSRFLAYRNRCRDDACVAQAYADRIDEIEDLADGR